MTGISRKPSGEPANPAQDFTALVEAVRRVHNECAAVVWSRVGPRQLIETVLEIVIKEP